VHEDFVAIARIVAVGVLREWVRGAKGFFSVGKSVTVGVRVVRVSLVLARFGTVGDAVVVGVRDRLAVAGNRIAPRTSVPAKWAPANRTTTAARRGGLFRVVICRVLH